MKSEVSIIIPTLDAPQTFGEASEIIVVDGGSRDATVSIAESYGVKILRAERGRGRQLQTGADAARNSLVRSRRHDCARRSDF